MAVSGVIAQTDYNFKDDTIIVNVPHDDIARLMYYLHGVNYCLDFVDKYYTDFENYHLLSNTQKQTVVALSVLLSPELLVNKVLFLTNDPILLNNLSSRYLEVTEASHLLAGAFTAAESIVIEGRTINISKIMLCNEDWLRNNYFNRIERQAYRLTEPDRVTTYQPPAPARYVGGGGGGVVNRGGNGCRNALLTLLTLAACAFVVIGSLCLAQVGGSTLQPMCGTGILNGILMICICGVFVVAVLCFCCCCGRKNGGGCTC